jgi:serine/threonine protein kinase
MLGLPGIRSRTAEATKEPEPVEPIYSKIKIRERTSIYEFDESSHNAPVWTPCDLDLPRKVTPAEAWQSVSRKDFKALDILGKGGFGEVKLVIFEGDGEAYAMKSVDKHSLRERSQAGDAGVADAAMSERNFGVLARAWQCPFLIEMYAAFQTAEKLYYMYELCPGGELFSLVCAQPEGRFEEVTVRFYLGEMVLAVAHLHQHDIIHRDVKLENVLLARDGHVKLADWGCVLAELPEGGTDSYVASTDPQIFMPPEFRHGDRYGKELDCWQLGVSAYAMLVGHYPEQPSDKEPLVFPSTPSLAAQQLCSDLLNPARDQRLGYPTGAALAQNHKFFSSIKWDDFLRKSVEPPFVWEEDWSPRGDRACLRPRVGTEFLPGERESDVLRLRGFSYAEGPCATISEERQAKVLDTPANTLDPTSPVGQAHIEFAQKGMAKDG